MEQARAIDQFRAENIVKIEPGPDDRGGRREGSVQVCV